MKIDIGESLIYSWLRHNQKCYITQMNWKTSSQWDYEDMVINNCQKYMEMVTEEFGSSVFGNTVNIHQLIRQCEIDVLGINTEDNEIFAVDIAYHRDGLNYSDTISTVTKKIFRSIFALLIYFKDIETSNVYFVSPIVGNSMTLRINELENRINLFLKKLDLGVSVEFYMNDKFKNEILIPTMEISSSVADMSELFLRSHQLIELFDDRNLTQHKSETNNLLMDESLKMLPIGRYAKQLFERLLLNNILTENEIIELTSKEYSVEKFKMNFPILKKVINPNDITKEMNINGRPRYYVMPINGYLLCNHWYERHRNPLNKWLIEKGFDTSTNSDKNQLLI